MKIDEDGNQEWHKHYGYEIGYQHFNQPFDVEQCADGGYLIVGKYTNLNEPGTQPRSWMVKTDPCGDVVWNGCVPVGIGDMAIQKTSTIKAYPNPTQDVVFFDDYIFKNTTEINVYDMMGRLVFNEKGVRDNHISIDQVPEGVYHIVVFEDDEIIYSGKILKE